jgi:hypothetical protein
MKNKSIKSDIYFNPDMHHALQLQAVNRQTSVSALVKETIQRMFTEAKEDLCAFQERAKEPEITANELKRRLKRPGKR